MSKKSGINIKVNGNLEQIVKNKTNKILQNGVPYNCPSCGKSITISTGMNSCPFCNATINFNGKL